MKTTTLPHPGAFKRGDFWLYPTSSFIIGIGRTKKDAIADALAQVKAFEKKLIRGESE